MDKNQFEDFMDEFIHSLDVMIDEAFQNGETEVRFALKKVEEQFLNQCRAVSFPDEEEEEEEEPPPTPPKGYRLLPRDEHIVKLGELAFVYGAWTPSKTAGAPADPYYYYCCPLS